MLELNSDITALWEMEPIIMPKRARGDLDSE